jgi:hypothetical protein
MRKMFELPLTPDEEYWAGFIHADGSISRALNCTRFAQKDEGPVRALHSFLKLDTKVFFTSRISNFGRNEMYSLATSKVTKQLIALGIKEEPAAFLYNSRHFWRGMIDGDGTVIIPGDGYPRIMLCGNYDDMWAFSNWCARLFKYQGPKLYRQKTGVWYVGIGSGKAILLGEYLYRDTFSAVSRKSEVALSFQDLPINHRAKMVEVVS